MLPTLNEAENLAAVVGRLREVAPAAEILIVDDESRDGTAEIADELARGDAAVHVLHRRGKKGYGEALTEGLRVAMDGGAELLVTMDCDFSHDPSDLPRLLSALGTAEAAIGSRYVEGGGIRDWPPHRRLLSGTANAFVRILFSLPARDCTSGFRAYRRAALAAVPWGRLHSAGYSFLVEVLFWVCRAGHRPVEVPILFVDRKRGKSKMGLRQIVSGAANLLRVRLGLGRDR